ncbi:Pca regulon regulatory protein [marine metagenome]
MIQKQNTDFVGSFAKGLSVLNAFSGNQKSMTLTEVAELTDMTRSAARRFLITLSILGYTKMQGRYFSLTPKVLSFSAMYLASDALPDVAMPYLHELAEQVHESCSLSELQGGEIIYVARVPTQRIMSINLQVGARLPAWCSSMGRAQLAYLEKDLLDITLKEFDFVAKTEKTIPDEKTLRAELIRVKEQGYALVDEELELGVISIAVPIFNRTAGQPIAALNVAAHRSRSSPKKLVDEVLPLLQNASKSITAAYPSMR